MSDLKHTPTRARRGGVLAAMLATALLAFGPAAGASATDLRSPDARDAGVTVIHTSGNDLRSPDAQDNLAALPESPASTSSSSSGGGTDWNTVGFVLGGVLLMSGFGLVAVLVHRRGGSAKPPAPLAPS